MSSLEKYEEAAQWVKDAPAGVHRECAITPCPHKIWKVVRYESVKNSLKENK